MTPDWIALQHDGRTVARYQVFRGDPPTADLFEATAERAAAVSEVFKQLPGWLVATSDDALADALIEHGAVQTRHSHVMTIALGPSARSDGRPEPILASDWEPHVITPGFRFDPSVADLLRRAYPSDHPDAEHGTDAEILGDLHRRTDGERLGPLLPGSFLATDGERPVGLIIVNRVAGTSPFGGPWVSDVCRDPLAQYKGLGRTLLTMAMDALVATGETDLSLAVTVGNSAQRVYESLGFDIASTSRKVQIPKA